MVFVYFFIILLYKNLLRIYANSYLLYVVCALVEKYLSWSKYNTFSIEKLSFNSVLVKYVRIL